MKKFVLILALLFALSLPLVLDAGGRSSAGSGHIKRSSAARYQFMKLKPCPATGKSYGACPGYVIDHIVPLKRGGADTPGNMQWQTKEEAKKKDRWE